MNLDLTRLTRPERIWLWRHRQKSPRGRTGGAAGSRMSAGEAAALLGVRADTYRAVERGTAPEHEAAVMDAIARTGRSMMRLKPTRGELLALARRRSGLTLEQVCAQLSGISRPHLYAQEDAEDAELVAFWRARGFTF